jgi:DNA-binding FadR family transcriptional regulator
MSQINYRLTKKNLYEQIADALEQAILDPQSSMEGRLPSEQALAERFGVSRTITREALKLLKERGLVMMKNGDGSYTSKPVAGTISDVLVRMIRLDNITDGEVYDMRVTLETAACRGAAVHATGKELDGIERLLNEMEKNKGDLETRIQLDCDFHIAIAKLSRNALLRIFVESMTDVLRKFISKGIQIPGENEDLIRRHREVLEALRTGRPEAADEAMRTHLELSRRNVLQAAAKQLVGGNLI